MIVEQEGIWYLKDGDKMAKMEPQPHLGKLRWDGEQWQVHMGYPHGHDVPIFNEQGHWGETAEEAPE